MSEFCASLYASGVSTVSYITLDDEFNVHSFIYLLIKVYKIHKCNKRQVKPSRTARLSRALTAALKTIKTVKIRKKYEVHCDMLWTSV